ncbi:MAG: phytanoyl-CoA dioxygenase family protein [Thermoleophilia bacterium]|nr:phytanoyl-CoA dioxygenase family protein [Thermoleophilia bacterium]
MEPTAAQIEAYRRDGFVVVPEFLPPDEVERARAAFHRAFAHEFETGLRPDEVNYDPASTPPELTRQLCNVWKADRTLAASVLAERNARFGARLAGAPGLRLIQDNAIWKPPSGKALLCHQDAAYVGWLEPPNMTTCWMALDSTSANAGTIYYVRGSNRWPHAPAGGSFHAPDDWLAHVNEVRPAGTALEVVPIEVPAGGAAFHDGWTFHGSPSNTRPDRERRAIVSHMVSTATRWADGAAPHPTYSKYRRPGERTLDDAFFPVLWSEDSGRSAWLDEWCGSA